MIDLNDNNQFYIFPVSDLHYGSSWFNKDVFDKWKDTFESAWDNKCIYLLGDLLEFPTTRVNAYDSNMATEDAVNDVIEMFEPYKEYVRFVASGNHECFSEDTELLSEDGWITHEELDYNTKLATYNPDSEEIEFQYPTNIFEDYVEEDLLHYNSRSIDLLVTKNHRLFYAPHRSKKWRIDSCENIKNPVIGFRQAGLNNNDCCPISDDEIRLIAWCLTDAHYDKNVNNITFYQRKSAVNRIIDLLDNLGIDYHYHERDRDIKEICGKKLKNKPEIGCEINLRNIESTKVKKLCPTHEIIPDIIYRLTQEQFLVFLEEIVFCDGSKHKSSPDNSWMVYKSKEFLDQLQTLCIMNNIRTSLTEYRSGHYRLNINPKFNKSCIINTPEVIPYTGVIFCATVPNDTLICRRNGKVCITGNSRGKKDFNLDVTKIIAKQLGAKYTRNDFYDKLNINGSEFIVYGKHGTSTSKYPDLAMKNFKIDMGNIDAHLYLQGHNHLTEFSQKFQRDFDGGYFKSYVFTGHFLNYKNSYAHNKNLLVSPPGFFRLGINSKLNVSSKKFIGSCKV